MFKIPSNETNYPVYSSIVTVTNLLNDMRSVSTPKRILYSPDVAISDAETDIEISKGMSEFNK